MGDKDIDFLTQLFKMLADFFAMIINALGGLMVKKEEETTAAEPVE